MNKFKGELFTLYKSFSFAFHGIKYVIDNERNMRIHLTIAFFVFQFSLIYGLSLIQYAILFLIFGGVIATEMLNTSIEALVDLQTSSYAPLGKVAKDVAAGAVLVLAIVALVIAGLFFFDLPKLITAFIYFYENPLLILIAVLELGFGFLFIFKYNKTKIFKFKK